VRLCLPPELPAEAVTRIAAAVPELAVEVFGFGRVPLAIATRCYHARVRGLHKDSCRFVCAEAPDGLAVDTLDGQHFLAVNGVQTLSYTCANLIEDVVDLATQRLIGTAPVGKRPYVVALANGRGFTSDQYGGTVSAFDLETFKPVGRVSAGEYPEGLEASADGRTIYVVNWFSNDVFAIDAQTLKVTARMPVGDGPRAFGLFLRKTP